MTQRNRTTRLLVAGALAVTLTTSMSCEFLGLDGEEQQAKPVDNKPKKPVETETDLTPLTTLNDGEYQRPEYPNMSRRNPFQPDIDVVTPANVQSEGEEEQLGPLQRFALGELELVAIISEVAVPKAMFIDPEGFGHVLKEGDRIGRNAGVLSDIRDNEVEVTETTGEDEGQTRLRTIKLREASLNTGENAALTEEERAAIEKLLQTEEGRKALEARYRDMALGASAVDGKQQPNNQQPQQGTQPPNGNRFQGIAPPR